MESSLFGMLMTLVRLPEATLMVPPCGERHQLVPHPEQVFTDVQTAAFFRTPWVIESISVPLAQARFAACDLNQSSADVPEISVSDLEVHVLSHRKREDDLVARIRPTGPAVLLLDLRDYAALWWSVCDEHKNETIEAAKTATGVMTRWVQRETSGRRWLFHPGLEARKRELRTWIAEKSQVAAQWRLRQRLMTVPRFAERLKPVGSRSSQPTPTPRNAPQISPASIQDDFDAPKIPVNSAGGDPVGFTRGVKNGGWLTTHMAAECGLWLDNRNGTFVFLGRPGDTVPVFVRDMLDPQEEWRPISAAEAGNFTSAKQLLRQAVAPYGLPPHPKNPPDQRTGR